MPAARRRVGSVALGDLTLIDATPESWIPLAYRLALKGESSARPKPPCSCSPFDGTITLSASLRSEADGLPGTPDAFIRYTILTTTKEEPRGCHGARIRRYS